MRNEDCRDAAGLSVVLGELRSEYYQLRKAEALMQRHRDKWMRSVEQWLDNQAHALDVRMDPVGAVLPTAHYQRARRPRKKLTSPAPHPALPRLQLEGVQLGPQRPAPQPKAVVVEEVDVALDTPQASDKSSESPLFRAPTDTNPRRVSRQARPSSNSKEAQEDARRMSDAHEQLVVPAQRRYRARKKWRQTVHETWKEPVTLSCFVENPLFDSVCSFMILFNSVIIGIGVNQVAVGLESEDSFIKISGYVCGFFFFIELVLRMMVQKRKFFTNSNRNWNIFDFLLVILFFVDLISEVTGADASVLGTGMKTVKMLRIVRVFRVFRFFRDLSQLALMIVDSMISLGWALILLAIIIYVFAILFTSSASDYVKLVAYQDSIANPQLAEITRQFGSLPDTIYSLVQAMLGGVSWGVCTDALREVGWFPFCLFFFYVAFTILAVMNVVTGVFVDNAVETARTQRDFLIAKEMELKEKYAAEMRELFMEMDADCSGTVGLEEINEYLEDPRVQAFFNTLGLDTGDTERLFKLIDDDGSGDVDVGEFLDGCLRLKGQARSLDVYAIMRDLKSLEGKVDDITGLLRNEAYGQQPNPRESQGSRTPQVLTLTTTATATLMHAPPQAVQASRI